MPRRPSRLVAPFVLALLTAPAALGQETPAGHPPISDPPIAAPAPRETPPQARRERPAREQGAQKSEQGGERGRPQDSARDPTPDSATRHRLSLPGRDLAFAATAGSVRLRDEAGEAEADIAYIYYRLDVAEAAQRPVVFFFNGGPGAASAWLQLGAAGPWRVSMTGPDGGPPAPSDPPTLLPNAETWLDFADLVFLDPVGTGWSRLAKRDEGLRKRFYSVEGDARSVARAMRQILTKHERLASPKYLVGESYGGVRGPKVAHLLATEQGVGLSGLALVSPLFDMRDFGGSSLLQFAMTLPSMAAVARAAKRPVTRADLADVERYAASDFLVDLLRGPADLAATDRLAARVAELTGLDPGETRRLNGRLSVSEFRRAFDRAQGRVLGRYDASVKGYDPFPDSAFARFPDPSSDALLAPLTSAITELTTRRLGWTPQGPYRLLSDEVNRAWDWGRGVNPPESLTQLREILALDPRLRLHVAHGLFDLATPYFASQILLAQLPDFGRGRISLAVHPGGHMFYSREDGRRALRADMEAMTKR